MGPVALYRRVPTRMMLDTLCMERALRLRFVLQEMVMSKEMDDGRGRGGRR